MHLCWVGRVKPSDSWREQWSLALAFNMKHLATLYPQEARDEGIPFDGTCAALASRDCGSVPGAVYCRIDTLGRALNALAFASASFDVQERLQSPALPPQPFDVRFALTPVIPFSFGDDVPPELARAMGEHTAFQQHFDEVRRLSEHLRELVAKDERPGLPDHPPWVSYVVASNDLVAFIVGREYQRAHGRCLIDTPSPVEADGTFDALVDLQKRGSICGNGKLSPVAVDADRCALRVLAKMDASMADPLRKEYANDSMRGIVFLPLGVGRRLAIDAFATINIAALVDATDTGRADVEARTNRTHSLTRSGFLNEQLRLYLFAATLQRREDLLPSTVRLCGNPALRFAAAIQHDNGLCGGERLAVTKLAKLFETTLSDKVIDRWSRGEELRDAETLDPASLACAPEKYCFSDGPCPFSLF
jgi:hypothetical protein